MTDAKILFWDSEYTPLKGYFWGLWDQNIGMPMVDETQRMLCWGARWYDKKSVRVVDERASSEFMLRELWTLLDEADFVVSWNGIKYDTRMANRQFLLHGITPPSPVKEIDLMRVAKQKFAFSSNKLDNVAKELGVGRKITTDFDLWRGVMAGDEAAWRKMVRYQKQDVNLLVEIFDIFKPWIRFPHPVQTGFGKCRNCGSENIQWRGKAITLNGEYARFQCQECGAWGRDNARVSVTNVSNIS